ncbi:uncharacterized protein [Physcomitrium patens]|uniref:TraB family protein n=1 Tax=Physcomitrium patens TaxID=3218 RepID=A0A2K1KXJ6_PHYPA|nr:traB domain-containing protein-like [Physcomitrium patens]PNR58502.1 hypothetical protein PHYPA_005497 [Physcomitrium patens]|eukprot:XP_024370162.1 traB domain-containing protein-like [Physcomitrella patens]
MIEGQMRNRMMDQRSLQDRDMMLLRELERRLRAAAAQGDTTHQTDIDELIKNLEGRLRPMKENIENETTEREKTSPEQPGYSTTYDYLNSWLKGWDHCLKEEELRLRKQRKETKNEQQPGVSSDRDVKSEGSASTSKEPCEAKTEDSSTTLKEKDHVKNSSEQPDVIRGDSSTTLKEDDQVYTPQDLDVKAENSSSDLKEQDQVYTPEMIQEIEDKKKRLLEEEFKKQNVERKKAEAPNSKQAPSDGTVVYLRNEENGADLYLVGTSHVSQQSADEVRDVIRRVKPDYVLVELDRKRYNSMLQRQNGQNNPFAFVQQMVETLTNNNIGAVGKVLGLGLSGFYWLLAYWGLQPGQEFKVAIQEGKKAGAKIVLGDQDIDVTLKHFGEQTSVAEALQFFAQPMPSDIAQKMSGTTPRAPRQMEFEQLRDRKLVRQLNEEMEKKAPALTNILLRERNESMTKALRNLSGKVVAVVGLAHLDGIEQLWREANEKYLNSTE